MNVLVSGASIAGPALAYWLKRNGMCPTLVERATAPRPGGQAVDVRGAAKNAIELDVPAFTGGSARPRS